MHKEDENSVENEIKRRHKRDDDNHSDIGLSTDGHLTMGIGSGLSIDTSGHLGIQIAPGFSIPLTGD
jgi:hypothetical protein